MLLAGRDAAAEIAVVRQIKQYLRAVLNEAAGQRREGRFITDEYADLVLPHRRCHCSGSRREVPYFFGYLIEKAEGPGNIFTERDQVDLVIAGHGLTGRRKQQRRVEWRAQAGVGYRSQQKGHAGCARQAVDELPEFRIVVIIKRRRQLRPDQQVRLYRRGAQSGPHREQRQLTPRPLDRFRRPLQGLVNVRLQHDGAGGGRLDFGKRREQDKQRQQQQPDELPAGPAQNDQRQRSGHHHEEERKTMHACIGRETHRKAHVGPGIAQSHPLEKNRTGRDVNAHPQCGDGRNSPP